MARDLDVIVAGHLCLDIIPGFAQTEPMKPEDVFTPGGLVNVTEAAVGTGGPVSNTGISLTKLGVKVAFMARVGGDIFGKITLDLLSKNADTSGIHVAKGSSSSYTLVIAPPGIDRMFFHNPATNDTFGSDDVDYELVGRAKIFHLGYPPLMRRMYENDGAELIKTFKKAKEAGAATSLDMSLPDPSSDSGKANWEKILTDLLPYVDIFLPSIEEGIYMARREKFFKYRQKCKKELVDEFVPADFSDLGQQFIAWGSKIAAIKASHRGIYIRTAEQARINMLAELLPIDAANWSGREIWAAAYRLRQIKSAAGSGDAAIAGLIAGVLRGQTIERTAKLGNALGYQNLHELDTTSGIKGLKESIKIIESKDIEQIPPNINDPAWRLDKNEDIYRGPADSPQN